MPQPPHPKRPEIISLLKEEPETTATAIAERLGVSPGLVAKVAKAEGLERPVGRPAGQRPSERREAVLILSAEGLEPAEIAATLECSRRLVDHYLQEARAATETE